jgi:hypothetical protein
VQNIFLIMHAKVGFFGTWSPICANATHRSIARRVSRGCDAAGAALR